jgi:hypothetical protein
VRAMAAPSVRRPRRQRGRVEELPNGALRVSVYAGIDPLTGGRHYLRETIPPGPLPVLKRRRSCAGWQIRSPSAATREPTQPSTNYSTHIVAYLLTTASRIDPGPPE